VDRKTQDTVPENSTPFFIDLEAKINTFVIHADYYNVDGPKELKEAYAALKAHPNDPDAIRDFQKKLTTYFIPDLYHVNSYLQQYLVDMFKIREGNYLLTQEVDKASGGDGVVGTGKPLFGECGFLSGRQHSASIVASSQLECYVVDHSTFIHDVLESNKMKLLFDKYGHHTLPTKKLKMATNLVKPAVGNDT
jgi:hypothetical protein